MSSNLKESQKLPKEFNDCISNSHHKATTHQQPEGVSSKKRTRLSPSPTLPLLDYLNSDIQYNIFSFFNYKQLIQARGVCKSWKDIVDNKNHSYKHNNSLWQAAYESYFGPWKESTSIHVSSSSSPSSSWSSLFRNKYLTERSLHFQRNTTTGYKYQTCCYLGCLFVLKSQSQQDKHEQKHIKEEEKEVEKYFRQLEREERKNNKKAHPKRKRKKRVKDIKQQNSS